ncbi:ABC transporter ATP-binding protein [Arthrobacter sp. Helios]|uniref:ABC transporter ATP-binding protein n=1 Tax=Arthrobacter sp. Helios TaxID=2828862 RepID=UPI00204B3CAD|nr:ABC transporter ATP-binding protein [Arthrobacter sp. Helios]UPO76084.1 energy-coupling factor ABC transporter ATP-binding protein [Arthrobacter sp. Helios]
MQQRTSPVAVSARNWGWRHAGRKRPAVAGADFEIRPGERVLLLGASGAGKSTLLHALAGVLGEDTGGTETGSLTLDGVHPQAARGRAGLLLQDPDTQIVLSRVGDEVAFGAENLGIARGEIWERVHAALDDVGLAVPLNHSTAALSGGQKQRLALASILAMQPGLLLLDEPTANLDPGGVLEIRDAVARVLDRTGATLIVVEHRVAAWAELVDRVIVLDAGGGVLADGAPQEVLSGAAARSRLAEAGVWLPGAGPGGAGTGAGTGEGAGSRFPNAPATRGPFPPVPVDQPAGTDLLVARGLDVARTAKGQPVLAGVDLTLQAGTALGITGPNGAGKSTLALTLGGLLRPRGGELTAAPPLAREAGGIPYKWKSAQLVTRMGTVFQEPEHQFLTGSVHDELAFGPRRAGRSEAEVEAVVGRLAERLLLQSLLPVNPFTLSGGEKRRLSVATMLATAPDILLLDEPTFGQDANTWRELVSLLAEQRDAHGCTVVSVTHDSDFTAALGGRTLRVAGGRVEELLPVHGRAQGGAA